MSGQITGRAIGLGMSPRVRLQLVSHVRTLWAADPGITVAQMVTRTHCPAKLVQRIRSELVTAGVLKGRGDA